MMLLSRFITDDLCDLMVLALHFSEAALYFIYARAADMPGIQRGSCYDGIINTLLIDHLISLLHVMTREPAGMPPSRPFRGFIFSFC